MSKTFVLVHGAFAGGWSWDQVKPLLENAGDKIVVVNLPGRTGDPTPYAQINAQSYADAAIKAVDAQQDPVILVGHSAGGATISRVAEARPDKVKALVYVAAYLLKDGETVNGLAQTDQDSVLGPRLTFDQATLAVSIPAADVKPLFLTGVPEPLATEAAAKVQPEPGIPGNEPVKLTPANYGRVPRYYVSTLQDKVISPALQKRMYTDTPVQRVFTLDTGHCPFASMPKELSAILAGL